MSDWQQQQHHDELLIQHDIEEVIKASANRPLTADEQHLLAWATGTQPEIH